MLKFLSLTIICSGVAIASLTGIAAGDTPISPTLASPTPVSPLLSESNSDDTFFCYMRTGDGRVMDLTRLCATTPSDRNSTQDQESTSSVTVSANGSQDVINLEGGLGVNGCYVFDENGRPCSSVQ